MSFHSFLSNLTEEQAEKIKSGFCLLVDTHDIFNEFSVQLDQYAYTDGQKQDLFKQVVELFMNPLSDVLNLIPTVPNYNLIRHANLLNYYSYDSYQLDQLTKIVRTAATAILNELKYINALTPTYRAMGAPPDWTLNYYVFSMIGSNVLLSRLDS